MDEEQPLIEEIENEMIDEVLSIQHPDDELAAIAEEASFEE